MYSLLWCAFLLLSAIPHGGSSNISWPMTGPAAVQGNVTSLQCIENFSAAVDNLYATTNKSTSGIERLVRNSLVPCLDVAAVSGSLDVRMLASGIVHFPRRFFSALIDKFNNLTSLPYNIGFDYLPVNAFSSVVDEILLEYKKNLSSTAHTGFLYGGLQLSTFGYNGVMADLSQLVLDEGSELGWLDILPFVRQQMATYNGRLVGIPLDGRANMIFYRSDLLQQYNFSIPATYDDLLTVVSALNGTKTGPNNGSIWGLCIPYLGKDRSCLLSHNIFWDILAPYTQTRGPSHGMAVDPSNLDILFDSEAGKAAVGMFEQLLKFTHPSQPCADVSMEYVYGECAVTFGRVGQFKMNQMSEASVVKGRSWAYPCPGSTHVLDRTTRQLVPCTTATCPQAQMMELMDGTRPLVNTAPFSSASGYAAAVSKIAPRSQQLATFRFLSFIAQSEDLRSLILDPTTWWGPCRRSHFNLSMWTEAGYPPNATYQFLKTTRQLLGGHNNIALPPNVVQFTYTLVPMINVQMLALLAGRIDGEAMLNNIVAGWRNYFRQLGTAVALRQLRAALNWVAPPGFYPPPVVAPPMQGLMPNQTNNGSNSATWKYITATSIVASVLFVGCIIMVLIYLKSRRLGKDLFGNVLPPNEGKSSTLVVTDMQDSTLLWESLPMEVMDVVIKVHHSCLRSLLPSYKGYESTSEGDSLILAFHDPQTALLFTLEAQKALLHAPWPAELLEHPVCEPLYMRLADKDPMDMHLESETASNDEASSIGNLGQSVMGDRFRSRPRTDVESCPTNTFADVCSQAWEAVSVDDANSEAGAVLAFRGARVRMGLHSGVGSGETKMNVVDDRRRHYVGACLTTAKVVADCGAGGTVSLSSTTYNLLSMEKLWKKIKLWHAGMHLLHDQLMPMHIYQVLPPELSCRVVCLPPVRSLRQLSLGALDAPSGCATIAFMKIAGLDTLKRWNAQVTNQALALWQQLVLEQLEAEGGYAVEAKEDVVLVAFGAVTPAFVWATQCSKALLDVDWPEELLSHEMGEQVSVLLESEKGGEWRNEVMMRGLRVKVGLDWGPVLCSISPMTGKLAYNGRVMNRAARIAARATPGQVLTTSYTWAAAGPIPSLLAAPLGPVKLKGISDDIHLMQVKVVTSSGRVNSISNLSTVAHPDKNPHAVDSMATIPSAPNSYRQGSLTIQESSSDDIIDQYTGEF